MRAMVLKETVNLEKHKTPLKLENIAVPKPQEREVLIKVRACGVCHTELDEIEGRSPPVSLPIIIGHQAVGIVEGMGAETNKFRLGDRVGVAWIYSSCGECNYCLEDKDNLCIDFRATGRDTDGGYAEYMTAPHNFVYRIPQVFTDEEAAPLLCAGAIGYRSLRLTGIQGGMSLGLTGFGASGHLVLMMVKHTFPSSKVYVFARNTSEREFARELGAVWTGDSEDTCPEKLDLIIDTTPVWKSVVEALRNLKSGGRLVINAIRKEESDKKYLLNLNYAEHLWMEKEIKSVANVSRRDVAEFLKLASSMPIKPDVQTYKLEEANKALIELKEGKIKGAKVLKIA